LLEEILAEVVERLALVADFVADEDDAVAAAAADINIS
jgi:hypothetical protein